MGFSKLAASLVKYRKKAKSQKVGYKVKIELMVLNIPED